MLLIDNGKNRKIKRSTFKITHGEAQFKAALRRGGGEVIAPPSATGAFPGCRNLGEKSGLEASLFFFLYKSGQLEHHATMDVLILRSLVYPQPAKPSFR
jgi:hypothetical protein